MTQEQKGNNYRPALTKAVPVLLSLAALFIAVRYLGIQDLLRAALDWVAGLGAWGIAAFVVLYVLATVLFLPGSILTLGAGALFGVLKGSIIVSLAATLGAVAAFLVGRYFARGWVAARIAGNPKFQTVDQAVAREGWKIVGLTRLSPVFPFNLLNYAFGLTSVSLRDYFWASWIGMIPGTVMFVYLGSLVGDLALLGVEERSRSTFEWGLYLLGLVATVAVTIFVTRLARAALAKKV